MTVYFLDSRIMFPDPSEAEPGGLLAVGGDLSPERLLLAYEKGIFPWYSEEDPILWFSPDPRMIFLPGDFRFSKTLLKTVASGKVLGKGRYGFRRGRRELRAGPEERAERDVDNRGNEGGLRETA